MRDRVDDLLAWFEELRERAALRLLDVSCWIMGLLCRVRGHERVQGDWPEDSVCPRCGDLEVHQALQRWWDEGYHQGRKEVADMHRLSRMQAREPRFREALELIAKLKCLDWAEGCDDGFDCSETSACITEWCPPCVAKATLRVRLADERPTPVEDVDRAMQDQVEP